eukprot:m.168688 g.168688  ORF g.168688 m.168688 type:complete len:383 (+) comp31533_c0_seq1:190-1338(+)
MRSYLALVLTISIAHAQKGPGPGPWKSVDPSAHGLSLTALEESADALSRAVSGRQCFLVVKEGEIVYEKIYSGDQSKINAGFSTTKSMCSTMFGIATQQGWAQTSDLVQSSVSNPRKCNNEAVFKNVLTMTGTSPDISSPRYSYDTFGTDCYDTLSGFVQDNNPEGLGASTWKDKHFFEPLGMEHSSWSGSSLACGTSAELSCRDLARVAQLWLNNGEWLGAKGDTVQLMSREHATVGTTQAIPGAGGDPYGYGLRLRPNDPVDPNVAYFGGVLVQCAFFSREHNAIVVSMGSDLFSSCEDNVWDQTRNAIVSRNHPMYAKVKNMTKYEAPPNPCPNGCPGPAPGMPNKLCPDGSVSGPVCGKTAGTCKWTIRSCPTKATVV